MIHLERQIEKVKKQLLTLGTAVEESLHDAIQAIQDRDVELADKVIDHDRKIDEQEIDVEEECLHALALHQPVAHDLRFLVSVLKINSDLERIGDLAVHIAEQAKFLAHEGRVDRWPYDLTGMSYKVEWMLRTSLDALVNLDTKKASRVREMDDEVDDIHRGMYNTVTEHMRSQPDQVEQMIHLLNISRQLERTADHACNISKDVLYLVEGEIVRHKRKSFKPTPEGPAVESDEDAWSEEQYDDGQA
jgi:phosphate transport system protein